MSDQNQYTTNESYEGGSEMPNDKNVEKDVDFLIKKDKETQKKIQEINEYATDYYEYLGDQLSEINTKQNNLDKQQKEMVREMERWKDDKVNLIEIVGIFVAIFTFISVQVQVFKGVTGFSRVAGLIILFFSGITFFLALLFYISETWVRKDRNSMPKYFWLFIIGIILVSFGGLWAVKFGDKNNPSNIKNNRDFIELENKNNRLEKKVDRLQLEMEEIKNNQTNKK